MNEPARGVSGLAWPPSGFWAALILRLRRAPTAFLPLLAIHLTCLVRFHIHDEIQVQTLTPQNIAVLLSGLVTVYALSAMADALTPARPRLRLAAALGLVLLQMILCAYHLRCRAQLDYKVVSENFAIIFHKESLHLIGGVAKFDDWLLGAAALLATAAQWNWRLLKPKTIIGWPRLLALGAVFLACARLAPYSYDEITAFTQSCYWSHFPPPPLLKPLDPSVKYPRVADLSFPPNTNAPDNVFVILVESFNANFARTRAPDGREYTPFFNQLAGQGLFFDNFWGNSMQTSRGQFAVLSSTPPLSQDKEFTDYPKLRLHCLSAILAEAGWETYFFQGFDSLGFEGTGDFMRRNGFNHVNAMDSRFISEAENKQYRWGWGIQDNLLYQKAFQYLDAHLPPPGTPGQPARRFVMLSTISSHMKFDHVPATQRFLYPEQKTKKERYANAIRAADEYLKAFFEELARRPALSNSLVIITGDHSFPVGEHGYYDSESAFYNEYFRTPLLLWGAGVKPAVNHDLHSQLDIAPTVLELEGVSAKTHFAGKSLFAGPADWVPLIQPYAGTYCCVLSGAHKYAYRRRGRQEFLFDLSKDPQEKAPIPETPQTQALYEDLRAKAARILENDRLVRENRIWPPAP